MQYRKFLFTLAVIAAGTVSTNAWADDDGNRNLRNAQCTHVMGFSQTADWYQSPVGRNNDAIQPPESGAIFESIVDGDRWQLQWQGGAGVDVYANPNHPLHNLAWNKPILSACEKKSDRPERFVFMISGPHGLDPGLWVSDIEIVVQKIRDKFRSVKVIALQPVVGGPIGTEPEGEPEGTCSAEGLPVNSFGGVVRASWQMSPILAAIKIVAAGNDDVVVGAAPRLRECAHYVDGLGHIENGSTKLSGGATAAVDSGLFYRDFDWGRQPRPDDD